MSRNGPYDTSDIVRRLDAILAELQSWTPIIAALNWHILGISPNGQQPAPVILDGPAPVDGTHADVGAADPRD